MSDVITFRLWYFGGILGRKREIHLLIFSHPQERDDSYRVAVQTDVDGVDGKKKKKDKKKKKGEKKDLDDLKKEMELVINLILKITFIRLTADWIYLIPVN